MEPEKSGRKAQSFLYGAVILSMATVLVKIFGFIYKIPIQNMIGTVATGYFQIAYTIYSTVFVITTAGLPVAVSKLVSEAEALNNPRRSERVLKTALSSFTLLGLAASLFLFFASDMIAESWFHNPMLSTAIRAVSPAVFFDCMTGAFRGFFQGHRNMKPTAISQTVEAGMKMVTGVILTMVFVGMGGSDSVNAAAAVGGVAFGSAFSFLYMTIHFRMYSKTRKPSATSDNLSGSKILTRLAAIAIPVTLGSLVVNLTNLIDSGTIAQRLQSGAGFTEEAADFYFGAYTYAATMFNLVPAFIMTMAISVVPPIASSLARGESGEAGKTTESVLRLSSLISLPASFGLALLSQPILNLLYRDKEAVSIASSALSLLGIATFFVGISSITNAILQATGKAYIPIGTMFAGAAVKLAVSLYFVSVPSFHINGAALGTLMCYLTIALLNIVFVLKVMHSNLKMLLLYFKPLVCSAFMGFIALGSYNLLSRFTGAKIGVLAAIALSVLAYMILVILLRAVRREDLLLLPKGEKIVKILKM